MGKIDKTFVMALPGNPLAAIIHTILMAIPIILKMQGAKDIFFSPKKAKISNDLKLKPGRVNIVLGSLKNGTFTPYKNNKYGSGMITPLVESNSIALFGESIDIVVKGSTIKVIEFQYPTQTQYFDYIM